MIADLHNHNHSRAYFWLKAKEKKARAEDSYNPWTVIASNMRDRRRARMASGYGQADLVKLWNGKVSLTFNALYPIEKNFFDSDAFKGKGTVFQRIVRFVTSKNLPLRDIIQLIVMRIPDRTIDFIQSKNYKYWEALNDEYEFAISKSDILTRNKILIPGALRRLFESRERRRNKYPSLLNATGKYSIPQDKNGLKKSLENEEEITMILTIEGAHAFGTDQGNVKDWLNNVEHVKTNWKHPVFFVTFAHHFDNHLCGHAHSFPDLAAHILNQSANRDGEFNAKGWKLIRKLLSITSENKNNPSDGYRILIDVKHMSAGSRKQYYEQIIKPCSKKGIKIPVIASHCGHSGRATLDELIDNCEAEKDDSFQPSGQLNNWNINVCDEDVAMIFETGGLLGLSMDQRIMGVPKKQKKTGGRNTILAVWLNIKAVLDAIYNKHNLTETEKFMIWNSITLGSDFEGFIDPINEFQTVIEYRELKDQLTQRIESERIKEDKFFYGLKSTMQVEKVVEKICIENARNFVLEHYSK